jgi:hypothetical protein
MPLIRVWPVSALADHLEGGIFIGQRASTSARRSRSACVRGSMAMAITGSGKVMRSRTIGLILRAQRVAGRDLLQPRDRRADLAGEQGLHLFAVIGVHAQQAGDARSRARARIEEVLPFLSMPA